MSRISSVLTSSRWRSGSPPASRTTRSVAVLEQPHRRAGDRRRAGPAGGPPASAHPSARCIATRFGASSPNTSVKNVSTIVTTTIAAGSGGRAEEAERLDQRLGQRHGGGRRGQEAGQGDADLDGGQEPVRVPGQPGQHRPRAGTCAPALQLALPQRHQRHLTAGEDRVESTSTSTSTSCPPMPSTSPAPRRMDHEPTR